MARITVEDCLERIPNLFDLVLTASKRSRRLANGAESMVDWENDKPTVVALREIAAGHVNTDILVENEQQKALDAVFEDEPEVPSLAKPPSPILPAASQPAAQFLKAGLGNDASAAQSPEAGLSDDKPVAKSPEAVVDDDKPAAQSLEAGVDDDKPAAKSPEAGLDEDKPAAQSLEAGVDDDKPATQSLEAGLDEDKPAAQSPGAGVDDDAPAAQSPEAGLDNDEPKRHTLSDTDLALQSLSQSEAESTSNPESESEPQGDTNVPPNLTPPE